MMLLRLGDVTLYTVPCLLVGLAVLAAFGGYRAFRARRRIWVAPGLLLALLAPMLMAASYTGLPMALTSSGPGGLSSYPSWQYFSVLRLGINAPGDAPPAWFMPSGVPCTISGGDIGSQVPSVDGGCFVRELSAVADVRQWHTYGDGTHDDSAAIQAALNAEAGKGCVLLPPPATGYLLSAAGVSIAANGCLAETPGAANGLLTAAGKNFCAVTLGNGAVAKDVVVDGNGTVSGENFCFGNAVHPQLHNIVARNANGGPSATGVDFGSSVNGVLDGSSYLYANAEGTNGFGATGALVSGITSYGNTFHDLGMGTCSACRIVGNYVYSSGTGQTNLITAYNPNNDILIANNHITITNIGTDGQPLGAIRVGGNTVKVVNNTIDGGGTAINISSLTLYNAGTVTVTNGSNVVGGIGTLWAAQNYYNAGGAGSNFFTGPDGNQYPILEIDSNTSLKLAQNYRGSTIGAPGSSSYQLYGTLLNSDVIVAGNQLANLTQTPCEGITIQATNGYTVTGNQSMRGNGGSGCAAGLHLLGVSNGALGPNTFAGFATAIRIDGMLDYSTGTASATNGNATVTGAGTAFGLNVPQNMTAYFQVPGSGCPPQAITAVGSDTSLTLATGYNCTSTSGSVPYDISLGLNRDLTMTGGSLEAASNGLIIRDLIDSTFVGFGVQSSGLGNSLVEQDITSQNFYLACTLPIAGTVQAGSTLSCNVRPE